MPVPQTVWTLQLHNAIHTMFCPRSLRFISLRATGNLDNSSFGTSVILTGCCFTIDDDLLPIFPFAEFLFLIVRRLAGLKWEFFVVTAFCSCRKKFQKAALQLKPGISLSFKIDESWIKRNILRHNVNKLPRKQVITAAKLVSQKV